MQIIPNSFQTPNELVDYWMPFLTGNEFKVLVVIIRQTFGWHKVRDKISISQFEKLTGIQGHRLIPIFNSLIEKGIIIREKEGINGNESIYYQVILKNSKNSYLPQLGGGTSLQSEGGDPPPIGGTQKTSIKPITNNSVVVVLEEHKVFFNQYPKLNPQTLECAISEGYSHKLIILALEYTSKKNHKDFNAYFISVLRKKYVSLTQLTDEQIFKLKDYFESDGIECSVSENSMIIGKYTIDFSSPLDEIKQLAALIKSTYPKEKDAISQ